MDLPGILPSDLKNLEASNDKELYEELVVSTKRLTQFISFAADDETWSSKHGEFYKLVLAWYTRQSFQERVKEVYLQTIILSFQEHYSILESYLPRPLNVQIEEVLIPVNPFIISVQSSYLKSLLKKAVQEKSAHVIHLTDVPLELVRFALHYLESASVEGLFRFERPTVLKLLELAEKWGIAGLADECQEVLKRYISEENVAEELLNAIKKKRLVLLNRCKDVFNARFRDGQILSCSEGVLVFEFINFEEKALLAFDIVKSLVTHLSFKGDLTEGEHFAKALAQAPRLIGLILSETDEWSPFFPEIPQKIYSLDVSKCTWLGDNELRLLLSLIPRVSILSLAENTQITYRGFAELRNLYGLKSLNLEKCSQLENDALNLILQGAGGLTELNLHGCRKLTDGSFYELGKRTPQLMKLGLSRTVIADGALADISFKCQGLTELELDHCLNITEAGLFDCIRNAKQLKILSIREDRFDEKVIRDLKKQYPGILFLED